MPEFVARPTGTWVDAGRVYESQEWGIERVTARVDGAANTFLGALFHKYNATIVYVRKIAPSGQLLGHWNVVYQGAPHDPNYNAPQWTGPGKIDDFYLVPSGTDLLVLLAGHDTNSARMNSVALTVIQGVYVPYTNGQQPEDGAAGAYRGGDVNPEPNPNPNPEPEYRLGADEFKDAFLGAANNNEFYNRFQGMVKNGVNLANLPSRLEPAVQAAVNAAIAAAIPGIISQVVGGVERLFDGGQGSAIVYQQLRNTSYSGCVDALNEGVPDEPTDEQEG